MGGKEGGKEQRRRTRGAERRKGKEGKREERREGGEWEVRRDSLYYNSILYLVRRTQHQYRWGW